MADSTKVNPKANPGTDDDSGKKKAKRQPHPLIGSSDANVYPFPSMPNDYDAKAHSPLKKKDFVSEGDFYDYRAGIADAQAIAFRERAEEARTMGSSKERSKAKRLLKMQDKIAELRAQLEGQGVDVDSLLERAASKQEA